MNPHTGLALLPILATTGSLGPAAGSGALEGIAGIAVVLLLLYLGLVVLRVSLAARRGHVLAGPDDVRSRSGPPESRASLHAAVAWLAAAPRARTVVLRFRDAVVSIEPDGADIWLVVERAGDRERRGVSTDLATPTGRRALVDSLEAVAGRDDGALSIMTFETIHQSGGADRAS